MRKASGQPRLTRRLSWRNNKYSHLNDKYWQGISLIQMPWYSVGDVPLPVRARALQRDIPAGLSQTLDLLTLVGQPQ